MKPTSQSTQPDLEVRYRTMLTLWFGLLMSVVMYFITALFFAPEISNAAKTPISLLTVELTVLGALLVPLSFVVKGKMLARSVIQQRVNLVQQALIVACAMCEVAALLGLVMRFLLESRAYYLLFLISAMGIALHFPRREHLLSATYRAY